MVPRGLHFTPGSITASCKRKCCRNETPAKKGFISHSRRPRLNERPVPVANKASCPVKSPPPQRRANGTLLALFSSRSFRYCSRLRLLVASLMLRRIRPWRSTSRTFTVLPDPSAGNRSLSQRVCQRLRDVYQTFFTAADGNKCAKVTIRVTLPL